MFKDKGRTRRFELTLHREADLSDEGLLIYSKDKEGKFPFNKDGLVEEVMTAMRDFIKK
jgi:hypothetical protein